MLSEVGNGWYLLLSNAGSGWYLLVSRSRWYLQYW
jgi:hypothetical protein